MLTRFYVWCAYQTLTQRKFGLFCRRRRVKSTHYFFPFPRYIPPLVPPCASLSSYVLTTMSCVGVVVSHVSCWSPCFKRLVTTRSSLAILSSTSMLITSQPAIVTLTFVAPMLPADSIHCCCCCVGGNVVEAPKSGLMYLHHCLIYWPGPNLLCWEFNQKKVRDLTPT